MFRKITGQFQQKICPYCFEYFQIKDTPFRCSSPPTTCAPALDKKYDAVWKDPRPIGKVIPSLGTFKERFSRSARCTDCNHDSYKRLCPHCHMELPQTTGEFKNHIYAVIGGKDSGKSHYIAVLIEQIKKEIGPNMGLLLSPENDFTIERYNSEFYKPVYVDGKCIDATKSGVVDNSVKLPMVYSLRVTGEGMFDQNKIKKYITLVFFDTAGEDLESEDVMSTVNKYIYRADGVILLIDPLQLNTVTKKLPADTPKPKVSSATADILNRTAQLIQKGRRLKPTEKIKTPIAVAFSKFDALLPLIDPQFQLHSGANHDKGFDADDFEAVNSEMMSLLDQWNHQDIIQMATTRFSRFGFFGLSALGCNPHDTRKIPSVVPSRVEDPFLWLLAQNGTIKKVQHS